MTKIISFPAFATPYPRFFLWIATSIAEADVTEADDAKTFFTKETATFISGSASLTNKALRN